jgi:chromosome partitioning protein
MISIIGCNKGGAGKTTTATNIAIALVKQGKDVVMVDADSQRSLSKWQADREESKQEPPIVLIEKQDNISQTLKALNQKYEHVIVDVAGRNSRELITGAMVADIVIAPHQASQLDLDTLCELESQVVKIRDFNPELKVFVYHAMASNNARVRDIERGEFLEYVSEFKEFKPLKAIGYYRKIYKDAIPLGKSVLELDNAQAKDEINKLVSELYGND